MRKLKRALAALVAIMLVFTAIPVTAFAVEENYVDFPQGWSKAAMTEAVENGLIQGYEDNTVRPGDVLTRAQMAAIINRAFGAEIKADISGVYADVNASDWYYDEIAKAVKMQTFQGGSEGLMRPNDPITRQDAVVVLARALVVNAGDKSVLNKYGDGWTVSDYAAGAVAAFINREYLHGYEDTTIRPGSYITREEFAQIMDNIFAAYVRSNGDISLVNSLGEVVLTGKNIHFHDTVVNGDLIIGDGVGHTDVRLTNVTVNGRLVFRGGSEKVVLTNVKISDLIVTNDVNNDTHGPVFFYHYSGEAIFTNAVYNTPAKFLDRTVNGGSASGTGLNLHDTLILGKENVKTGTKPDTPVTPSGPAGGSPIGGTTRYSVTYDYDGGSLASGVTAPPTVYNQGAAIVLPELVKTHYTLSHWIDVATGATVAPSSAVNGTLNVKAVWIENNFISVPTVTGTEKIYVDKNGKLEDSLPDLSKLPANTADKTYMNGWFYDADGSGFMDNGETLLTNGATLPGFAAGTPGAEFASGKILAYFEWNVEFILGANEVQTDSSALAFTVKNGEKIAAFPTFTKKHYTFKQWTDGTNVVNADTFVTGALTISAEWYENNKIEIPTKTGTATLYIDTTGKVEDELPDSDNRPISPNGSRWQFKGWYYDANGNNTPDSGETLLNDSNKVISELAVAVPTGATTVLKAYFEQVAFLVTFETQSDETLVGNPTAGVENSGDTVPANEIASATKQYKTFKQWVIKGTTTKFDETYPVTADITVVAEWYDNNWLEVPAKSATAVIYIDATGKLEVALPVEAEYPLNTADPGNEHHYNFLGWYYDANSNGMQDTDEAFLTDGCTIAALANPAPNGTAYAAIAVFKLKQYTVTFNAAADETLTGDATVTLDAMSTMTGAGKAMPEITKKYHEFAGWIDANGNPFTSETPVLEDAVTLTATWNEHNKVELPTKSGSVVLYIDVKGKLEEAIPAQEEYPVQEHKIFTGWFHDADGNGVYDAATEYLIDIDGQNVTINTLAVTVPSGVVTTLTPYYVPEILTVNYYRNGNVIRTVEVPYGTVLTLNAEGDALVDEEVPNYEDLAAHLPAGSNLAIDGYVAYNDKSKVEHEIYGDWYRDAAKGYVRFNEKYKVVDNTDFHYKLERMDLQIKAAFVADKLSGSSLNPIAKFQLPYDKNTGAIASVLDAFYHEASPNKDWIVSALPFLDDALLIDEKTGLPRSFEIAVGDIVVNYSPLDENFNINNLNYNYRLYDLLGEEQVKAWIDEAIEDLLKTAHVHDPSIPGDLATNQAGQILEDALEVMLSELALADDDEGLRELDDYIMGDETVRNHIIGFAKDYARTLITKDEIKAEIAKLIPDWVDEYAPAIETKNKILTEAKKEAEQLIDAEIAANDAEITKAITDYAYDYAYQEAEKIVREEAYKKAEQLVKDTAWSEAPDLVREKAYKEAEAKVREEAYEKAPDLVREKAYEEAEAKVREEAPKEAEKKLREKAYEEAEAKVREEAFETAKDKAVEEANKFAKETAYDEAKSQVMAVTGITSQMFDEAYENNQSVVINGNPENVKDYVDAKVAEALASPEVLEKIQDKIDEILNSPEFNTELETEIGKVLDSQDYKNEVEAKIAETLASQDYKNEVEAKIAETLASQDYKDKVEQEITDYLASDEYKNEVEAKIAETLASQDYKDKVEQEITDYLASDEYKNEVEAKIAETLASQEYKDKVEQEITDYLASDEYKNKVDTEVANEVANRKPGIIATLKANAKAEADRLLTADCDPADGKDNYTLIDKNYDLVIDNVLNTVESSEDYDTFMGVVETMLKNGTPAEETFTFTPVLGKISETLSITLAYEDTETGIKYEVTKNVTVEFDLDQKITMDPISQKVTAAYVSEKVDNAIINEFTVASDPVIAEENQTRRVNRIKGMIGKYDTRQQIADEIVHFIEAHVKDDSSNTFIDSIMEIAKANYTQINTFVDSLANADTYKIGNDELFIIEAINVKLADVKFEDVKDKIPAAISRVLDEDVIESVYNTTLDAYRAEVKSVIDIVTAPGYDGTMQDVSCFAKITINPVEHVIKPYYDKFYNNKLDPKLDGYIEYVANPYLALFEEYLNWNKVIAENTASESGYSLMVDGGKIDYNKYYDTIYEMVAILYKAGEFYFDPANGYTEEQRDKVTNLAVDRIGGYYDRLAQRFSALATGKPAQLENKAQTYVQKIIDRNSEAAWNLSLVKATPKIDGAYAKALSVIVNKTGFDAEKATTITVAPDFKGLTLSQDGRTVTKSIVDIAKDIEAAGHTVSVNGSVITVDGKPIDVAVYLEKVCGFVGATTFEFLLEDLKAEGKMWAANKNVYRAYQFTLGENSIRFWISLNNIQDI